MEVFFFLKNTKNIFTSTTKMNNMTANKKIKRLYDRYRVLSAGFHFLSTDGVVSSAGANLIISLGGTIYITFLPTLLRQIITRVCM